MTMTEGPTPRDPREDPPREPVGGPEAPVDQPPPDNPPADTPPAAHDAPRWESPGTPPPPPPPPSGGQGWGQQPGEYGQPGGGYQQPPGGYQQPPGGYQQPPGGYQQPPGGYQQPGGQYPAAGSGMSENVSSGLSYVLTWLTGLIFFLVDKRPEVRFHAMQSIAFGLLWTLVAVVGPRMPFPIDVLLGLLWVVFFVTWIILMIQGFQGRHFKLPVLGDFAEQQAGRPGI
jgi:uncharacterized membrane protein